MKNKIVGIIYLSITAIIWGGSFISQLFGGLELGSYSFIAYRCFLGCITIAFMIYFDSYKKYKKIIFFHSSENIKKTILNSFWCGIILFLSMITQQIGVEMTDTAKAGLITALEVIFVPIIMMVLYKSKIKFITWIFIFLSLVGILFLSLNSVSKINFGDFLVFVSAILYSITIIQVPKYISFIDPLKFSFFRFLIVGIFGLILAIIFKNDFITFDNLNAVLPSILYAGVLSSGIAYTFQILGQKHCDPIIATLIMSLEGIFAAIFGWIILGQSLNFLQVFGCILTTVSICFVQISDFNTKIEGLIKNG